MSLIELMVGLVIALVLSLVMFKALLYAEGQRRTTSSGNDAQQAGSLGSYELERTVRMGGSGFSAIANARGCVLNVFTTTPSAATRVPLPTLPAPFDGLAGQLVVSPVLIANAAVDNDATAANPLPDALIVMAGNHPSVDNWLQTTTAGANANVQVLNSVGLATQDLLMAVDSGSGAKNGTCTVVQTTSTVDTTATDTNFRQSTSNGGQQIDLGSTYTSATGLTGYSSNSQLADLGTSPDVAVPQNAALFKIFAVAKDGSTTPQLSSYDMFTGTVQALNDNVVNLQAVYGLSATAASSIVTEWDAPVGNFSLHSLRVGDAAAIGIINRIRAVRLAILTRSALREKNPIGLAVPSITMFADIPAAKVVITPTGTDLNYRYRLFDIVIPLRNH